MKKLNLIPYIGGKFYHIPEIYNYFPSHSTYSVYVELFGGGASVLLNKRKSKYEIYNDTNGELVNLFLTIKENAEEFLERCQWLLKSREIFKKMKEQTEFKDDIDRAIRFFYILCNSREGHLGGGFSCGAKAKLLPTDLSFLFLIKERLKRVIIENLDFEKCISIYDSKDTFFYCDPPYFLKDNYYSLSYQHSEWKGEEEHLRLHKCLTQIKGKFLLSYNDCKFIRALYKDYNISERVVYYGSRHKLIKELVIYNYVFLSQKQLF